MRGLRRLHGKSIVRRRDERASPLLTVKRLELLCCGINLLISHCQEWQMGKGPGLRSCPDHAWFRQNSGQNADRMDATKMSCASGRQTRSMSAASLSKQRPAKEASHPVPERNVATHASEEPRPAQGASPVPLKFVVEEAVKRWFEDTHLEASRGDIKQQALLGQMYAAGYGTKKDKEAAKEWTNKAASKGLRMGGVYCDL